MRQQQKVQRSLPKQGYKPDFDKYLAKKLRLKLNGGREIEGIVIGIDVFMNIALEKAYEIVGNERKILYKTVVRGNSILMWELLEKVTD
jgi:small nuclear ribonucleoprotein G